MTTTQNLIHTHTPRTDDVRTWLETTFPEGDLTVVHTDDCDRASCGDECVGGCPVVDCD